jgi:hypothetical protein
MSDRVASPTRGFIRGRPETPPVPSDRLRCVECREPIPDDARICPHCRTIQPSPLLDVGVVAAGVFALLFGVVLAAMTVGTSRLLGFVLLVVGFGLAVGGYTRYVDRQAASRAR